MSIPDRFTVVVGSPGVWRVISNQRVVTYSKPVRITFAAGCQCDIVNSWHTGMLCVLLVLNTNAASVVGLTPAKLDFGLLPVGTASQPRTGTVTNTSNSALTVRDISASGIDFSQTNTCPLSLPAGGSCAIDVIFKPAIDGPRIGTIIISTSDPASPRLLVLTGTGQ